MPDELMVGPCIEVWSVQPRPDGAPVTFPAFDARRRWQAAVKAWAVESGWATDTRPAANAMNLARTRIPWSRVFLLGRGMGEWVDYYEGMRSTRPEGDGTWQPSEG